MPQSSPAAGRDGSPFADANARIQTVGAIVPEPIEQYLADLNHLSDSVLLDIARAGRELDLPLIDAETGALLRVLALAVGATRILEIGTAIGYSGVWLAGALPPGGTLVTMEAQADRAKQARDNFSRAGLGDRANVMVGDAALLVAKVSGPFDLIFQDGDKLQYGPMLDRLVHLLRPGGLLIADNVLRSGEVVPGYTEHPVHDPGTTRAIADYNRKVSAHPALLTANVPLRDGLSISVKRRV
jgi:predicted O-methyltransferase YrrM